MRAGKLRHKVTVQRVTTQEDMWGDLTWNWNDQVTAWASIEPLRGDEYFAAAQTIAQGTHKVTMRGIRGDNKPTPKDRLIFGTRIFEIKSVLDTEERGIELVLMCIERLGETYTPPPEPPEDPGNNGEGPESQ